MHSLDEVQYNSNLKVDYRKLAIVYMLHEECNNWYGCSRVNLATMSMVNLVVEMSMMNLVVVVSKENLVIVVLKAKDFKQVKWNHRMDCNSGSK